MKKPSARRVIAATCTPGRPSVVNALLSSSSRPANAPLNTCSFAFGSATGCSPVALELDGTARIAVAVAPEAFGAGGGGAIAEAFFAAAAATADPGVITIVFSNSSG